MQQLLSADQTGRLLGVTVRTLYTLSQRGELPCIKIGRSVRYDPRDIDQYIQRNRSTGKEARTHGQHLN